MTLTGALSQSAYASLVGCSRQYIHELIRDGKLVPPAVTPDKKIVVAEANRQPAAQRDPTKGRHGRPTVSADAGEPMLALIAEPSPAAPPGAGPAHGTLAQAKLETAQNQAKLTAMQVAKLSGELADVAAAIKAVDLAVGACLEVLGRLGDDAVEALRGAATTEDAPLAAAGLASDDRDAVMRGRPARN